MRKGKWGVGEDRVIRYQWSVVSGQMSVAGVSGQCDIL